MPVRAVSAGAEIDRRFQQLAAQVLEQPDGLRCLGDTAPAPAGPVQHRPHQRQAAGLAREAADHLHPPAGLAEGALDEVGVTDPLPVLAGETQMHGEGGEVVAQAGHRLGIQLAVTVGELPGPAGGLGHRPLPGRLVDVVEDRPERRLDLGLGLLGDLGDDVPAAVDQTPLAQTLGEHGLQGGDQARARRRRHPTAADAARALSARSRNPAQASVDSAPAGARPMNTGLPSVVIPQAASTGSAGESGCILKFEASKNR